MQSSLLSMFMVFMAILSHPARIWGGQNGFQEERIAGSVDDQTDENRFYTSNGRIEFSSDAPLELINAWSSELRGVLESNGKFAFSVAISSFDGFNSGLQREHFKENYLEITRFPKAEFEGELIEVPNLTKVGTYPIRVRGRLEIHGISRERIIPATIKVNTDGSLSIETNFQIPLRDHNINIPKIMHQKIAESVLVIVQVNLKKP